MALRTPLHDSHIAAGARMVEFGGFDMPLQYSTIREEHIAVRTRCGLFDLSHMGEVRFSGDGALDVVQRLVTNDVARLEVGGALYPVYVRGEVYLLLHKGKEAAAEFQKFLDHRGVALNSPLGALARLQLGRAYALQGDAGRSRGAYKDFVTLWSGADPDIPLLILAKSEYEKLN